LILYIAFERFTSQKFILPQLPLFDEMVVLTYSVSSVKDFSISFAIFQPINLKPWFKIIKVYLAISIIQITAVAWY